MIFVEQTEQDGEVGMVVTPCTIDLSPNKSATMRSLGRDETPDDMDSWINNARGSMDEVTFMMVDHVISTAKERNVPHFGYVDLVEQFQAAPHLLLANMLAQVVSGLAQEEHTQNVESALTPQE